MWQNNFYVNVNPEIDKAKVFQTCFDIKFLPSQLQIDFIVGKLNKLTSLA